MCPASLCTNLLSKFVFKSNSSSYCLKLSFLIIVMPFCPWHFDFYFNGKYILRCLVFFQCTSLCKQFFLFPFLFFFLIIDKYIFWENIVSLPCQLYWESIRGLKLQFIDSWGWVYKHKHVIPLTPAALSQSRSLIGPLSSDSSRCLSQIRWAIADDLDKR